MSSSGIAHDLNSVLTIMIGWAQLARRDEIDPQRRAAALEILELSARRARVMVRDCLDDDRPAVAGSSLVVVDAVIEELLEFHALSFERKGIAVAADLEPGLEWEGDAIGLFRVVDNLLGNAAEAMNEGGHLRVKSGSLADERLCVVVEDDGPGVDPSIVGRLFEHGFTSKVNAPGEKEVGGGIGLGVCRRIAREHGGDISYAPAPQGGSCFTLELPRSRQRLEAALAAHAPRPRSSIPPGLAVLVADDEEDIREMIQVALTLRGALVVAVADGDAAVAACREEPFDLALIDFSMPGLSGHDLGLALSGIRPEMPILFMSGSRVGSGGVPSVVDFLKKPFDLDDVQDKVREIMSRREARD